jgi:hypothetical protein
MICGYDDTGFPYNYLERSTNMHNEQTDDRIRNIPFLLLLSQQQGF